MNKTTKIEETYEYDANGNVLKKTVVTQTTENDNPPFPNQGSWWQNPITTSPTITYTTATNTTNEGETHI